MFKFSESEIRATLEKHQGALQCRKHGWAAEHETRLQFAPTWPSGVLAGCPGLKWGAGQNGTLAFFAVQSEIGATLEKHRGALQCRKHSWAAEHGTRLHFALTWPSGVLVRCPGLKWGAGQNGKCGWEKNEICTPRGAASVRPQLIWWIPGGVLKSGSPGSDGEPGCGFSWALGGHPGGAPRLPGSAWRAGQNGTLAFFAVHTRFSICTPDFHVRG